MVFFGSELRAQRQDGSLPVCPDILILNSYSPGYPWSEDETQGLLHALKARFSVVEPVIQYLDTKRFPLEGREESILRDVIQKCRARPPKVLVTLDNAAFDFALKHRDELGRTVPIVFGGLNRFSPEMIAGQAPITGISEESDYQGTFDLIRHLKPGTRKIVVVNSKTESGRESRRVFEQNLTVAEKGQYEFEYLEDWTNETLIERMSLLREGEVGFLLETSSDSLGRVNYNDPNFTEKLSTRTRVPLFINSRPPGPSDWSVEPWLGVGGAMVRADFHGEKVGELVCRVLAGEPAEAIPVVTRTPTVMEVDFRHMKRLGISESLLPPGTHLINGPENFYRINRNRLIETGLFISFLILVIIWMYFNLQRRKRAEKALLAAQAELELLASAMSQASDVILILDGDHRVRYANGAYERVTGNTAASARNVLFDSLWQPEGVNPRFSGLLPDMLSKGLWTGTFELLKTSGNPVRLQVSISPLRGDQGSVSHFLFVGRDITLEVKLQAQVHSSQKMEAVGMLAGGIAHDFNNILQVIRGECSMLTQASATAAEMRTGLGLIEEAADRAAQLTQQLLVFSRKQNLAPMQVDLNELVSDWLKIVRRLIGEHIEVEFRPAAAPCTLLVDRGQIEQVLLNLCVNARDAMPSGGKLSIALSRACLTEAETGVLSGPAAGEFVCIEVSDTGCGMPSEVAARVFEPFFTTKPLGQGTGLGLSVAYGIVQQHHGLITLRSEVGRGTVFDVYLPVSSPETQTGQRAEKLGVPKGSGIILVAEDDEQVRSLAGRMLTRNGFEVLTASDGALAIAQLDQHHEKLSLVVLDVLMPVVSGPAVYQHMKAHYPKIPVLFCSGYSSELLPPGMVPEPGLAFLNKPYTPHELLEAVHGLLGRK